MARLHEHALCNERVNMRMEINKDRSMTMHSFLAIVPLTADEDTL
jgi:hypothetical protein